MSIKKYQNAIYAGVLGKILGVYLGRPIEGWSYEKIRDTFGEVYYYKNHQTGAPLIVPDDDISGTFAFFRALEDNHYNPQLSAEEIGNAWLNYIVENETILWWGGLCRSTEHTAYIRLKSGIKAPQSGSEALNGKSMSEQIGSQIFIDTWALANPNNPRQAARMAKKAASVSHDGLAIDAAVYLAVMEALAFEEKDIDTLLDRALEYVTDELFIRLVKELRTRCAQTDDWHVVRDWIAAEHGYEKYPGNCPMVTNHLALLMAFIMGGDSFNKSCMIACSAGWDTDCNSGNVGCLNGIRLGLEGFAKGTDIRGPVADRLYVVTSDSGETISDAVLETRKIIKAAAALAQEEVDLPQQRYAFEYPGSVQGVIPFNDVMEEQVLTGIDNSYDVTGEFGCRISYRGLGAGVHASCCVDTFIDLKPKGVAGTSYFDVLCSPTLYSGQEITAEIVTTEDVNPDMQFFIQYFNENDDLAITYGKRTSMAKGSNIIKWVVPDTAGHAIYRLGWSLLSETRQDGCVYLKTLDWTNAPIKYEMGRSMEMTPTLTPWTTTTSWLKSFVSSADHFNPDYTVTFSVCHEYPNGVATTGTAAWDNYQVTSVITFSQQDSAGLVARAKGHRQYYGAVFTEGCAVIYKQKDDKRIILGKKMFGYLIDHTYQLTFKVKADKLEFFVDGKLIVAAVDQEYRCGQAGFVVDSGAILGDGFTIQRV